jgi:hypothetical protein
MACLMVPPGVIGKSRDTPIPRLDHSSAEDLAEHRRPTDTRWRPGPPRPTMPE